MPDFHTLLTWQFWFDIAPSPLAPISIGIGFGFFAALVLIGILLRVLTTKKSAMDRFTDETLRRFSKEGITMGVLGLILFFFSYEQIHLFGAKFWYILWLAVSLVWLGMTLWYALRTVPSKRAAAKERIEREKYLPKSKKR